MKKIIIIFAAFFWQFAFAKPVDELQHLLSDFKTMTANFTQTVSMDNTQVLQRASGNIAISRPGKFYWNKAEPVSQQIIVNGNKVWIVDPDLEQVTIRKLTQSAGDTPAMLLSGKLENLDKIFDVTALPAPKGQLLFQLMNKMKDSTTSKIVLGFENNKIVIMQIVDQLGNITEIHFSAVVINGSVNTKLFDYKPPKNIDVINEQ